MDPERSADCVPEFAWLEFVLAREHLDPVFLILFDRDAEAARDIQNIETAEFRGQRFSQQNPEMAAASRLFYQRLKPIFTESHLEPEEIAAGIGVVCIDRNPLRALRIGIDCVETYGEIARKVALHGRSVDAERVLR
jgi:hypothetical protein